MEYRITDPNQPKADDVKKRIQKLDRYISKVTQRIQQRQADFQQAVSQMSPEDRKKFNLGLKLMDLGDKGEEV